VYTALQHAMQSLPSAMLLQHGVVEQGGGPAHCAIAEEPNRTETTKHALQKTYFFAIMEPLRIQNFALCCH
jgi:hypothetical protein